MSRHRPPAADSEALYAELAPGERVVRAEHVLPGLWFREQLRAIGLTLALTMLVLAAESALLVEILTPGGRIEQWLALLLLGPFLFLGLMILRSYFLGWRDADRMIVAVTTDRLLLLTTGARRSLQWAKLDDAVAVSRRERADGAGNLHVTFHLREEEMITELNVLAVPGVVGLERLITYRALLPQSS